MVAERELHDERNDKSPETGSVSNMVCVSALERGQAAEVSALWNEAVEAQGEGYEQHALTAERLDEITRDDNYLPSGAVVATDGGETVGFALGYVQTVDYRREGNLEAMPARLAGIAVKPGRWRQGIGCKLLEAVEGALAQEGKTEVAFETWRMPVWLLRGPYLDTGPYRFLLACGYRPLGHGLLLRNDLDQFELTDEMKSRRDSLFREGVDYKFYEPADRDELLEFMARHFSGGWHLAIERATEAHEAPKILMALADGQIVGFMGPFHLAGAGQPGHFGSPGVAADFRGRGIGKVMFHLGLDYLKNAGASETSYSTGVTNSARFIYFDSGAELVSIFCTHFHKRLPKGRR